MSGKTRNKGSLNYDSYTKTVATAQDGIDEQEMHLKVSRVLEVCPNFSKDETILVLQHFSLDEGSAINALMENGASDILKDWTHLKTGTKPITKPKKKKNKKKKGPAAAVNEETENSSDNNRNVGDDQISPSREEAELCNRNTESARTKDFIREDGVKPTPVEAPLATPNVEEAVSETRGEVDAQKSSTCSSPHSEAAKYISRDRHRSSGSSRTASFSEDASRHSSTSSYPAGQGKISLEKSIKDLSRQTVALQRIHNLLEEELDQSFRRIKTAITEAHRLLEERNQQLEEEMEKVKKEARQVLSQRQNLAAELKRRTERMSTMSEIELNDLRADMKHFVVERKYDEELGKTKRFMWDKDRITREIKAFGEIEPVKNCYSQRRQSTSSVASSSNTVVTSTHSDPFSDPLSDPLVNQDVSGSPVDSAETSAIEETAEQKDHRQQGGNRTRTFYPKSYNPGTRPNYRSFPPGGGGGRGGRGWRGTRGSTPRREDGYYNQQLPPYQKYPYQQRVNNSDTTAEGGRLPWEHKSPYRGNRPPQYRGRGHNGPRYGNYSRSRHPSTDLQLNGETPKPADSSNIANGFVAH